MKQTLYILSALAAVTLLSVTFQPEAYAQRQKPRKAIQKDSQTTLTRRSVRIVDANGAPIDNAEVISSEGAFSNLSDKSGNVSILLKTKETLTVKAEGYRDAVVPVTKNNIPTSITLYKAVVSVNGVGSASAVSETSGEQLSRYPDQLFSNTLQGQIAGLTVISGTSGLGNNNSTLYVRGLHAKSDNTALVIIDGMERSLDDIVPEEVAMVEVLKDASAKILYGSRAANGVVMITTRRGTSNTKIYHINVESGARLASKMPEYLNSYDYATLYNEARANDGMPAFYSAQQIDGYRNSTGENDLFYPNVEFNDYFLRQQSLYRRATFDMSGGIDRLKYAMVVNYVGQDGFEQVGTKPNLDILNVRGNLDIKVTDFLKVVAGISSQIRVGNRSNVTHAELFSAISTTRPNEYPLMISPYAMGLTPAEDGTPFFGASNRSASNLLADVAYGGFYSDRSVVSMANIGLNFDFDKHVKGLSASATLMYDTYTYFAQNQTNVYPTYALHGTNPDEPEFLQMRKLSQQSNQSRSSDSLKQTIGAKGDISYHNSFGVHEVSAVLNYSYFRKEANGNTQNLINDNTVLDLGYGYDQKYFLDATMALMGSNRFAKGGRMFLAYSVGASWLLSNEEFLVNNPVVDFLKLKASYGVLGYDAATNYLLYNTTWKVGTKIAFGEKNTGTIVYPTLINRIGSRLQWERDTEWNIGIEAALFGNRLKTEINYFNELRDRIICARHYSMQNVVGDFVGMDNVGKVKNHGIDVSISWNEKIGDLSYQIGANAVWSRNTVLEWNEVDYPDGQGSVGKPSDAIIGYNSLGLFGKDVALATGSHQALGSYTDGDIAYADVNGDNVVDPRDRVMIGNTFPKTSLGLNIDLQYREWELYVLGTAQLGLNKMKTNAYYWNYGEGKYSVTAKDRWHAVNNPNGTYPALTTTSGSNNFVNSDFWMADGSFFRLKDVELSYTFSLPKSCFKKIKLFARGTNLFIVSAIKELDGEVLNAGVTNYPMYRTITGGLSITL